MRNRHLVPAIAAVSSAALATTALAATPVDVQWSAPQAISTTPTPGGSLQNGRVASSADGADAVAIWAQYQGDSKFRVWSANTHDAGSTWGAPSPLSADGVNAEFPDIAVSDDGERATAIWYASAMAGQAVRSASSSDGGDTWTPKTIAGPVSTSRNPQLAGSADGTRVVAIWGEYATQDVLRIAHSSDGGITWSTPADLSDPDSSADDPAGALSADGWRAVAAYGRYDGTNSRAIIRTSSDGGANWNPPITVSDAGENAGQPQIAMSDDGSRVALAWVQYGSDARVSATFSADAGATWSDPEALSAAGEDASLAQIAGSADGEDLTLAWQISENSDYRIQSRSSTDAGAGWTAPVTHSAESSAADNPELAVSADGTTVTIAWYRIIAFQPSQVESVTSADSGASWTAPDILSDTDFDAGDPIPAISADGRTIITTWSGADANDTLIRAATATVRTVPGAPTGASAVAGDATVTASWSAPAGDGGSPVTGYTATATPGGQTCSTSGTSCTITGLANGTSYTVSVRAANALGTGPASAASNPVTPSAPTPLTLAVPTPPTDPPASAEDDPPTTKVIAKVNDKKSKLKVKVKPDLGKKKQWEFVVKVKKKGDWKTIKTKKDKTKVYETEGADHKLTIDLDEGKYKAKSKPARGYEADTSDVVKLKK